MRSGLLLHILDQVGPLYAFGPTREVLDQGGDGELAAGFMTFQNQRGQVGTGSVDGSGESGATGAENYCVASRDVRHIGSLSVNARALETIHSRQSGFT
jgi:hypothetical protein